MKQDNKHLFYFMDAIQKALNIQMNVPMTVDCREELSDSIKHGFFYWHRLALLSLFDEEVFGDPIDIATKADALIYYCKAFNTVFPQMVSYQKKTIIRENCLEEICVLEWDMKLNMQLLRNKVEWERQRGKKLVLKPWVQNIMNQL
jgi:hypothetical protein